jgi:hypothetical protein
MEKYADLHVHTSFSDSIYSPEDVMRIAKEAGLAAVGICDHDTIEGIKGAMEFEDKYGVEVIPGIEMSSELGNTEVHILGYFFDWKSVQFRALLKTIQEVRTWRAEIIVAKLQKLGFNIHFSEVLAEAGGGTIGRPHIARLLLKYGYVKDQQEAFEKYLKFGGPAYVGKYEMYPEQAIEQIKKMYGVPVLAHMKFSEMSESDFERLIKAGLKGLEVYHARHNEEEREKFLKIAQKYKLIITGGSDSHGPEDPIGCAKVPYEYVQQLKAEKKSILFKGNNSHGGE